MVKDVTIFTTTTCSSCSMVKRWLNAKGIGYNEVNIDQEPARQAEAIELSGAMTVPVTVVTKEDNSRQVVVGYNLAKLAPAVG